MRVRSLLPLAALAAAGLMPGTAVAESCGGLPSVPATYICVGIYPQNAPGVGIGGSSQPVFVPEVCYFAGCTAPTTYDVPVPSVTPQGGSGQVVTVTQGGGEPGSNPFDAVWDIVLGDSRDEFEQFVSCTFGHSC